MPDNNRFHALFKEADEAFHGAYKEELNCLMGLSKDEIDLVTPDSVDLKVYAVLTKVVENASKENLSQAQLIDNIKSLGDVAIKIARKVPRFAALL